MDKPLTGQVAFVTGASSGLGRRFAHVLADAGAAVAQAAPRTERLAKEAAAIAGPVSYKQLRPHQTHDSI